VVRVSTVVKIVLGIFLTLFAMSVLYLVLTSPKLVPVGEGIEKIVNQISPELGQLLYETYCVVVRVCYYAYKIFSTVISTLYSILKR